MESTIDLAELKQKLVQQEPNNESRSEGYALVNVLSPESFREKHIPGSINIPKTQLEELARRFDKSKEIIVYCASFSCSAGPDAAKALRGRGLANVRDYAGGIKEWEEAGNRVEGERQTRAAWDPVDEAGADSFPASDPPSRTPVSGVGLPPRN